LTGAGTQDSLIPVWLYILQYFRYIFPDISQYLGALADRRSAGAKAFRCDSDGLRLSTKTV